MSLQLQQHGVQMHCETQQLHRVVALCGLHVVYVVSSPTSEESLAELLGSSFDKRTRQELMKQLQGDDAVAERPPRPSVGHPDACLQTSASKNWALPLIGHAKHSA